MAHQIATELREVKADSKLVGTLAERNRHQFDIATWKPADEHIVVAKLDKEKLGWWAWPEYGRTFPNARCWVMTFLPAYSDDRQTALLRFYFGPTAHGAACTVLLKKDTKGQWSVTAIDFSYYA